MSRAVPKDALDAQSESMFAGHATSSTPCASSCCHEVGAMRSLRGGAANREISHRVKQQLAQCEAGQILKVADYCGDHVKLDGAVAALQKLARDPHFKTNGKDRRISNMLEIYRKCLMPSGDMDLCQLTTSCWAFARLQVSDAPLLARLESAVMEKVHEMSPQEISSTAWAFARLDRTDPRMIARLVDGVGRLVAEQHALTPAQTTSFVCLAAKATEAGTDLFQKVLPHAENHLVDFEVRDLCNLASAVAGFSNACSPLLRSISCEVLTKKNKATPVDFVNIVWAVAEVRFNTESFLEDLQKTCEDRLPQMSSQELGHWLWAFWKVELANPKLLAMINANADMKADSCDIEELGTLLWTISRQPAAAERGPCWRLATRCAAEADVFTPQQLANALQCLSRLPGHDVASEALAKAVCRCMRSFSDSDLVSSAWCLAQMGRHDVSLVDMLAVEVQRRLHCLSPQQLISLAGSFATMGRAVPDLVRSITSAILGAGLEHLTAQDVSRLSWAVAKLAFADTAVSGPLAEQAAARVREFQAVNLANVLWSSAKLLNKNEKLVDSLCGASVRRVEEFNAQNLANTVWAIATLNYTLTEKMSAFIEQSIRKIHEFGPQGLANMSWAFAKMEQKFDELMAAVAQEVRQKIEVFEPQNLSNTAWAFAALRIEDAELMCLLAGKIFQKISQCSCRDLASISWSFARLHLGSTELLVTVSEAVQARVMEFEVKGLSNAIWAFAVLSTQDEPVMSNLAAAALQKIRQCCSERSAKIEDLATDLNGLTWAMERVNFLTDTLATTLLDFMQRLGRMKDVEMTGPHRPPPAKIESVAPEDHPGEEPMLRLDLPDMCCVHKPAGWEVDNEDAGGGPWMSSWLMEQFSFDSVPIVHYEEHQFGLVQRLDIPSSGLILAGKTWEGFYTLKFQLQTGLLVREYVLLVHGWVALDGSINKQSFAANAPCGAPAPGLLRVAAHLRRHSEGEEQRFSLVLLRVTKSRRGELRQHFVGAGHPTVADGKYSEREAYLRDREWCARKFMHCFRLQWRDSQARNHEYRELLPKDLRSSLAALDPCCRQSAEAVYAWIEGHVPRPWGQIPDLAGT
ncbi:RAP [Symbiodinium natans]|uniref:RAP protein n=1 Tax=Symbiodinium natans TaxID=878477 RepID=A0A812NAZ4_9DINO|nr:RAP [Symbiodinium natans]